MSLFKKIKKYMRRSRNDLVKTGEELSIKAEDISKEGIKFTKERLSVIGEKAKDITNMIRYKMEIGNKQSELDLKYQIIGDISIIIFKSKKWIEYADSFNKVVQEISDIQLHIDKIEAAYQELRKKYSTNYEIKKLSDDLGQGEAVISQVTVSEKSNMVNKRIKENLLPKEALISVLKRGEEVIIPDGNTTLNFGDEVTVIGKESDVEKVTKRLIAG
jgi:uncharacterized protein with PhoU and TrkA domain